MRAIILAAGRGNRMGSLTAEQPKGMTALSGKPLLSWQIRALRDAGAQKIGIVRGYKKEKIKFENAFYFENLRWQNTNMVQSLCCAHDWLEKETCVVSYSDIIYPAETIVQLRKSKGDIVISFNTEWLEIWRERFDDPLEDAEKFRTSDTGKLLEIGGKADFINDIQGQYMGLIKFTPLGWLDAKRVLSYLPSEFCDNLDMTSFLQELIKADVSVNTIPIQGKWFEFDNEKDLITYQRISHKMKIL